MKIKDEKQVQEAEVKETVTKGKKVAAVEESLDKLIPQWKKQFGRIYKNTIDDVEVIWRPIRRGEYRELLNIVVDENEDAFFARQEKTCAMAVLYPKNVAELIEQKAGVATVLSEEILAKSGFDISETEAL